MGATQAVQPIAVGEIHPSKTNPRQVVNGPALEELVASVNAHGVLQPILVRPNQGGYEIVAGHRRFAAAQKAGLGEIPALVRALSDREALEIQLIENLERRDLHPLEEAAGYQRLMKSHGYTVERLAERTHRSIKYIYDRVKLLQLTKEAQRLFLEDRIAAGHAIILARLKPADQARAIDPDIDVMAHRQALWAEDHSLFDEGDEGERQREDPYASLKPRSVRELQLWVDEHVRAKPEEVDPVLFPETVKELDLAGRGGPGMSAQKKIIPITHLNFIPVEAREGRTFGPRSWKRADGEMAENGRLRKVKSKTCEHSVTGFVAVGPGRGEAFAVCVNKDRCAVHWPDQVRAKKKRAAGEKAGPAKASSADREAARRAREKKQLARDKLIFEAAQPKIAAAFAAVLQKASVARLVEIIRPDPPGEGLEDYVPRGKTAEEALRYIAWCWIASDLDYEMGIERLGKSLGVDTKPIMKAAAAAAALKGKPTPGTCSKCGCTEDDACEGGCSWANKEQTLCSSCARPKTTKPSKSGSGKTRARSRGAE